MITLLFYLAAAVALFCSLMIVTRRHAVHALLYLVVAQLAVAVIFYLLGAPFAAVLEVLVYAGAVLVMFVFVVMMLNLGRATQQQESAWLPASAWLAPAALCALLLWEMAYALSHPLGAGGAGWVGPQAVGKALFGPYLLVVELASLLLLAGLVGAWHLSRHYLKRPPRTEENA